MQMCFWRAPRLPKDVLTPFGSRYQDKAVSNTVLWKTAECDRAHPPTPTTPFIPSTCNGAPAFSCTYLPIMHKVLSFGSLMGTQYITHVYGHISSCRSRAHHLFFVSQRCRTIAILSQPFRNLLHFLFQWCRPEALVLQLCLTVYMIKCSICSYISWAISDKCYQSSYFSE